MWYDRRNAGPFLKGFAFPAPGGEGIPRMVLRFLWDGAHIAALRQRADRCLSGRWPPVCGISLFGRSDQHDPVEHLLALADDDALAGELLTAQGLVNGFHLPVVDADTALLHQTAGLTLAGAQAAADH